MENKHPRDRQRGRVYAWANKCIYPPNGDETHLTLLEIEKLVGRVWKRIVGDGNPPIIKYSPRLRLRAGWATADIIAINPRHPLRTVVLHELTHSILDHLFHKKFSWHGSTFLALYINLLVGESKFKKRPLLVGAKKWGLTIKNNKDMMELLSNHRRLN